MSYHNPTILAELNKVIQFQKEELARYDRFEFEVSKIIPKEKIKAIWQKISVDSMTL